jgi:predicted metal-dependent hydrolase
VNPAPQRCAVDYRGGRIEYTLVRSARRRRTIGIVLEDRGEVVVRAPLRAAPDMIDDLVRRKAGWIEQRRREAARNAEAARSLTVSDAERAELVERAQAAFEVSVARWAPVVGKRPSRVLVRNQKRQWGSCAPDGTLRLNWRLVLLDPELLDYVVVHELAHLRVRNHSPKFWSAVAEVLPDFKDRRKRLRESGFALAL